MDKLFGSSHCAYYFVDLRGSSFGNGDLRTIAERSGGEVLNASDNSIEHLKNIISDPHYKFKSQGFDPYADFTDTDEDGFFDIEEINGWMYKSNGTNVHTCTNPESVDSDSDDLKDNKEMDPNMVHIPYGGPTIPDKYYYRMFSDPGDPDTDDDGLSDGKPCTDFLTGIVTAPTDPEPLKPNNTFLWKKHKQSMEANVQTKLGDFMK